MIIPGPGEAKVVSNGKRCFVIAELTPEAGTHVARGLRRGDFDAADLCAVIANAAALITMPGRIERATFSTETQ